MPLRFGSASKSSARSKLSRISSDLAPMRGSMPLELLTQEID